MPRRFQPANALTARVHLQRIAVLLIAGLTIGGCVSVGVGGLLWSIEELHGLLHAPLDDMTSGLAASAIFVCIPLAGGLLVALLLRGMYRRRAHGLADLIAAVQTGNTRVPTASGLRSTLASVVSMGSGASVGEYGPLAHFGGVVGAGVSRLIPVGAWSNTTGIACGVAAAIAATFNAPIAGILFVHEVVLRHFSLSSFAPVAAAAIVAYLVAGAMAVREPLLLVGEVSVGHFWEFGLFALIGTLGALLAVVYMRGILAIEDLAERSGLPAWLRPAGAGLALGLVALWLPEILGTGADTLRSAIIDGQFTVDRLGLLLIGKLALSMLCLGMGFAGGFFGPALVSGALYGALAGTLAIGLIGEPHANASIYGICGMVALASPVIGAPLATVLIVFELTHSYTATLSALASVAVANLVTYRLFGRSLFDVQLGRTGLDVSTGRGKAQLSGSTLKDLLRRDYPTLDENTDIASAVEQMSRKQLAEICVVDHEGYLVGMLTFNDAYNARLEHEQVDAGAVARKDWPTLNARTSIWQAMDYLKTFAGQFVPVVESTENARLLGVVSEQALVSAYLETMERVRREEHGAA